jgi:hypothetical protein
MHLNAQTVQACNYMLAGVCAVLYTIQHNIQYAACYSTESREPCSVVRLTVYPSAASWLFATVSSRKGNKKQNLEPEIHLFSSGTSSTPGTAYWLYRQHYEFFLNSSQSCVILPSLQQRSDAEDSASESYLFASLPSRVLKLNPLLEFLKISKTLLKSLLQLVDIKLLSLMWH